MHSNRLRALEATVERPEYSYQDRWRNAVSGRGGADIEGSSADCPRRCS
jgi:hypothetical protein